MIILDSINIKGLSLPGNLIVNGLDVLEVSLPSFFIKIFFITLLIYPFILTWMSMASIWVWDLRVTRGIELLLIHSPTYISCQCWESNPQPSVWKSLTIRPKLQCALVYMYPLLFFLKLCLNSQSASTMDEKVIQLYQQ